MIKVTFYYRIACGTWKDVQVTKVERMNPICNSYTMAQLVHWASEEVIKRNDPMNWTPILNTDPCETQYRAVSSSCWKADPFDPDVFVQCPSSGCCLTEYTVCVIDGTRQITQGKTTMPVVGCGPDPACELVCGH